MLDASILLFLLFAAFALLVVAEWRFYGAYLDRYGGAESRRRSWPFWMFPSSLDDTVRPPWSWLSWLKRVDDPLVERRRRQHLLAWGAVIASFLLYAILR